MVSDVHGTVEERLRRARQRYTAGRQELIAALLEAGRPVSIAELVGTGASASQSSLYRNLTVLESCGVVLRIPAADGVARFEVAEDLSRHHHHLVCSDCGRIEDVDLPGPVEAALRGAMRATGEAHGYEIREHRLELHGVCTGCR
jgi:Fur family transcriptional regulator, ferric uptake regulator